MPTILLSDNNTDIRENTCEILELGGYDVIVAENGKSGTEITKAKLPDVIICDVMMPILDGYGVINILNMDPQTSHMPFIFFTSKSEKKSLK